MVDTTALATPIFWVRATQLVFGIIAFAPIADASGYSRVDFAIVCGVFTMLLSIALMAAYLLGIKQVRGLVSLVPDVVLCIFWLSCAAALSDTLSWADYLGSNGRLECSVAFSWLTWFLFIGSVVLDVMDLRAGQGISLQGATTAKSTDAAGAGATSAEATKGAAGAPAGHMVATVPPQVPVSTV